MANAPLVSVCIPMYNGARYLQAALDSASAQTLTDLEILCVDDGSTDGTLEIVRAHQARDPRVVLVRNEENQGLVGNWNRCLELAKGTWIKFLFQDDLLEPTCLERMLALGSEDCRFVSCARRILVEEGARDEVVDYLRTMPTLARLASEDRLSPEAFARLHAAHLHENLVGEPPCVMFHRTVPDEVGLFDSAFRQFCDLEYWLRVGSNLGVGVVRDELATFRTHGASTTTTNRARRVDVTNVDKVLLTRKVQTDPRFERLRNALPSGWTARNTLKVLSSLARERAHAEDAPFAAALRKDPYLARFYDVVRRFWVPVLDGGRRLVGKGSTAG